MYGMIKFKRYKRGGGGGGGGGERLDGCNDDVKLLNCQQENAQAQTYMDTQ